MMKKTMTFLAMLLMVMAAGMMVSCGGDDGGESGGGSGTLNASMLIGKTYTSKDATYGTYDGAQKNYEVKFINERIATVHTYGRDLGDYGYERWDNGTVNCPYSISGNTVTINYKNGDMKETIVMTFKNNAPIGWELADDEGYNGQATTEWLATGYYFCKEVSNVYVQCRDMASAGDKEGIARLVNSYGADYYCVVGVQEGNQLGSMYAKVSLKRPTDQDAIQLGSEYFLGYTVYFYTYPECYIDGTSDWSTWSSKGWSYTGNALKDSYGHTYKKVK